MGVVAVDSNEFDETKVSMGMAGIARYILKRLDYEEGSKWPNLD